MNCKKKEIEQLKAMIKEQKNNNMNTTQNNIKNTGKNTDKTTDKTTKKTLILKQTCNKLTLLTHPFLL